MWANKGWRGGYQKMPSLTNLVSISFVNLSPPGPHGETILMVARLVNGEVLSKLYLNAAEALHAASVLLADDYQKDISMDRIVE
jgi:hypothetical protein